MDTQARRIGLVLALGGLLIVVDTTVTVVALPAIVADLDSTLPTMQWVTTGYLLGVVTTTPVAGWAANRFGDRRVYVVALITFTAASVMAGFAWDAGSLIGLRVLQGLGGGLLNPVGMALGLRAVPRGSRGAMMSLLGIPLFIGPVLGPPLAGLLVDAASWRWIFWINLPVGLLALALCLRVLPPAETFRGRHDRVDWLGLAQVPGGAVLLVLGITTIAKAGSVTPGSLLAVLAGLVLLGWFVRHAFRTNHPLIEVRLLRHPPLAHGAAVLVLFGAGYFGSLSIGPVFVQGVRGDPAAIAGALGVPMGIAVGLTLQVATRLVDRTDPRRVVLAGTTIALLGGLALFAATSLDASYLILGAAGVVLGVGSGATLMPTMTAAMRDLEGADTANGTTLLQLLSQLAAGLGTALVASTLTLLVDARVPGLAAAGEGGLGGMQILGDATRATLRGDLAAAVGSTYIVPVGLFALAVLAAGRGLRSVSTQGHSERGLTEAATGSEPS